MVDGIALPPAFEYLPDAPDPETARLAELVRARRAELGGGPLELGDEGRTAAETAEHFARAGVGRVWVVDAHPDPSGAEYLIGALAERGVPSTRTSTLASWPAPPRTDGDGAPWSARHRLADRASRTDLRSRVARERPALAGWLEAVIGFHELAVHPLAEVYGGHGIAERNDEYLVNLTPSGPPSQAEAARVAPGERVPAALAWIHPELAALRASPFELAARHPRAPLLLVRGSSESEVRELPLAPHAGEPALRLLPLRGAADVERALAVVARDAAAFAALPPIPLFVAGEPGPRATRLLPCWQGLLPGDAYPSTLRGALRELVRLLFPRRALLFRALEHFALTGIDLAAEAARWREPAPETASPGARVIAIEGLDGSGKSTHLAALRSHLEARGVACATLKVFRHGVFHATATELVRRCAGGHDLHLWRLERLIKTGDSLKMLASTVAPELARCDVALFDRYTCTHEAFATARLFHDPWTRELLAGYPRPARVYLLDLPAEEALARIATRGARTIDENRYMLARLRRRLLAMAARSGWKVLDARAPFEENQAAMRADLDRLLAAHAR